MSDSLFMQHQEAAGREKESRRALEERAALEAFRAAALKVSTSNNVVIYEPSLLFVHLHDRFLNSIVQYCCKAMSDSLALRVQQKCRFSAQDCRIHLFRCVGGDRIHVYRSESRSPSSGWFDDMQGVMLGRCVQGSMALFLCQMVRGDLPLGYPSVYGT